MANLNLKPTLNQLSNFRYYAEQDEHFNIFSWDNNDMDKMSLDEFQWLKRYWTNSNYFKAKSILQKYLTIKPTVSAKDQGTK